MRNNLGAERQTALRLWKAHEVRERTLRQMGEADSVDDGVMAGAALLDGASEGGKGRGDASGFEKGMQAAVTGGAAGFAQFAGGLAGIDAGVEVAQPGLLIMAQCPGLREADNG